MKKVKLYLSLVLFILSILYFFGAIVNLVTTSSLNATFFGCLILALIILIPALLLMQSYRKSKGAVDPFTNFNTTDQERDTTLEQSVTEADTFSSTHSQPHEMGAEETTVVDDKTKDNAGGTKKSKRVVHAEIEFYKSVCERAINFIKSQPTGDFWGNLSTKLAARLVGSNEDKAAGEKASSFWTTNKKAVLFLALSVLAFTSVFNFAINYLPITSNIMSSANEYLDSATKHALETFAVLRGVNATVSALKDSTVDIEPAGIGVTAAPGEVLQPTEDIVEQASTIMLISAASLGTQKVLIKIGSWIGFNIFLGVAFILLFAGVCIFKDIRTTRVGITLILISVIIKLAIPLTDCAIKAVSDKFLQHEYHTAFENLHNANMKANIGDTQLKKKASTGIIGTIEHIIHKDSATLKLKSKIETLKAWATGAVEYVLSLIVIFILETVIFPVVFLFLLVWFVKHIFYPRKKINVVPKTI